MEKKLAIVAEATGYTMTALFAAGALMCALDNWGDYVLNEKTTFYTDIYQMVVNVDPPQEMLTPTAYNGRVGVFATFAGFSFSFARWVRSTRIPKK